MKHPTFPRLIAEIGSNHEGDFEYAKRLLVQAARSGADAVKFQTFSADLIVNPKVSEQRNKHFARLSLTHAQFAELAELAEHNRIQFMSSLWDQEAVKKLDSCIKVHKVGSGDLTNYPLLKVLVSTGKPLILSTAMSHLDEIKDAVKCISRLDPSIAKDGRLALLHCVAMYGAPQNEYANLQSINVLRDSFPDLVIGYSDHTVGMYACELALAMGAKIIEKHFTDDITRTFRDHAISATEADFREFSARAKTVATLLGSYTKDPIRAIETEERITEFRRAVYPSRNLPIGTILSTGDLITLRPLKGIDARDFDRLIGKKLLIAKSAYEPLDWEDFQRE